MVFIWSLRLIDWRENHGSKFLWHCLFFIA
jgi:hypothetical protein